MGYCENEKCKERLLTELEPPMKIGNTGLGGVVKNLAYCPICKKVYVNE